MHRPLLLLLGLLILPCCLRGRVRRKSSTFTARRPSSPAPEEPERTRGFRAGIVDAVIKLTGNSRLTGGDRLLQLLENPHRFIETFEYEDRMKGIPVHDEQGTRERPHYLRMRFKAPEMDAALKRLGLAKWPADRPMLGVWLGVRTAIGNYVLAATGPEGYGQRLVIVETAARRGLPVRLPGADGSATPVTFDIAAGNVPKLRHESPAADALLSGVLSATPEGYWDIAWRGSLAEPLADMDAARRRPSTPRSRTACRPRRWSSAARRRFRRLHYPASIFCRARPASRRGAAPSGRPGAGCSRAAPA